MKKCKYHVGCYGLSASTGGFKQIRVVTGIQNEDTPMFERGVAPMEFTSDGADNYMRRLLDKGWIAVTLRVPHDRERICYN